jgi:hypothetical protein
MVSDMFAGGLGIAVVGLGPQAAHAGMTLN